MKKIAGIALVMFLAFSSSAGLAFAKSNTPSTADTIKSFLSAVITWPSIFSFYHSEEEAGDILQEPEQESSEERQPEQEPQKEEYIEEFPEEQVEEAPDIFQFTRDLYAGVKTNDEINDEIYRLQEFLLDQGFYPPDRGVSGVFGSITTAAVKKFQAKYKLSQTGHLDDTTREVINKIFKDLASGYFEFEEEISEEEVYEEKTSRKSKLGDINGDGEINSGDAIILRQFLEGEGDLDNLQLFRADVNQDGRVNPKDWKIILDYDAGIISKLPVNPDYKPSSQTTKGETPAEPKETKTSPSLPDVAIINMQINPDSREAGKFATLSYTVKNVGKVDFPSKYFEPNIYVVPVNGTISRSDYIVSEPSTCFNPSSISPGYECDMTNEIAVNKAGVYNIYVVADSGLTLKESDESNNAGKVVLEVSGNFVVPSREEPDNKPKIIVGFPNGGDREYFKTGGEIEIKWSSENLPEGGRLAAELYKGDSFAQTISPRMTNDGEFRWQIPSTLLFNLGPYYKIRIFYHDSKGILVTEDYSDSVFAITDAKTTRPTLKFTASPYSIKKGETAKLFWTTTGAEDGCVVTFDQGVDTRGSNETAGEVVRPEADKTYQIACRGAGGVADAELTIKVSGQTSTPAPTTVIGLTVRVEASPISTYKGQAVTISWESSDKTSVCNAATEGGFIDFEERRYKDSIQVKPEKTTKYTVLCSGTGGKIHEGSIVVTIGAVTPPKLVIVATPEITFGEPVEGQTMDFRGKIVNEGGSSSNPTKVNFHIDFVAIASIDVPSLGPKSQQTVNVKGWGAAEVGEHELVMCLQESTDRNDCKELKFKVKSVVDAGPSGYTFCAREGDRCNFSGVKRVAFGANGKFRYLNIGGGFECSEYQLGGDPITGVRKACYFEGKPEPVAPPTRPISTTEPDGYTFCAKEGSHCNFSGTKSVAYGANGKFKYFTMVNGVRCEGTTFNTDPIPGVAKNCYLKDTVQATIIPAKLVVTGHGIYSGIAIEGQAMKFKGSISNTGGNTSKPAYAQFFIDNSPWDDAAINVLNLDPGKSQQAISAPWKAETGEHTLSVCVAEGANHDCQNYKFKVESLAEAGPVGYTFCAKEGGRCNFSGVKDAAYGANGKFKYLKMGGGFSCESFTFSNVDPIPGTTKSCYFK